MAERQPHVYAPTVLKELFKRWSITQKLLFGGLLIMVVLGVLTLLYTIIDDDQYRVLYANLDSEDYIAVSNFLRSSDIDFHENLQQRSIYVPADRVHQLRLELASQKLPSSASNGSDPVGNRPLAFMESMTGGDPLTALQLELSRTLAALDHIRAARVHLEFPSAHVQSFSRPGATVLLSLAPGRKLTKAQLHTVIHLVSASVSGLESRDVTVFDTSGNLLSEQTGSADAVPFPDSTLSYQTSVERNLERKVQDLVDAMIGKGHTLIRISATLDFSRNETTSERYDPDETVVRSEQIERQPVTDTDAENPPEENVASRYRSSVATSSQVEYEISKTTRRTVHPVGELKQLAVTILVTDQKMIGDDGRISYQPRSEEDLEAIRSLVAGALPLKPERGDTVQMGRVDVERLDETLSPAAVAPLYDFVDLVPVGKIIIIVIFFVLFYWLLLKPIIGFLRSEMDRIVSAPVAAEQQADDESRPEAPEEDIGVKLKEDVRDQPLAAAHIIRRWIQEA